jgi:DNA-binding transcriptional LysR family regulator
MELRHLRSLIAIAEERSFTRAAERLHVAQPALSVQIRQLEAELGAQLFDRSRRTIALTDAGTVMVAESRELLSRLDRATTLVRQMGAGAVGRLSIGFVPSASNAALPPLLRRFGAAQPDVVLELRELAPAALVSGLHEGRLDIAFLYLPFDDPGLEQAVITREPFLVALPSEHPLAARAAVAVADLADERFVLPADHGMPGLHAQVLDICRDAGFAPRTVQEDVWLVQTIAGLVSAGVGVALLPASARALTPEGVVYRPLADAGGHLVELAAIWRRDDTSPVLRRFLAELTQPAPS